LFSDLHLHEAGKGSLDVDDYVKSKEAVSSLKLPKELVVVMALMGLLPCFGSQRRMLESRKDLFMEIIKKDLPREALRLKLSKPNHCKDI
jgi:hypothetical protein